MEQCTARRGFYSKTELVFLASSLGFPGHLFIDALHPEELNEGEVVSEGRVTELLDSGALFTKLEKVFNTHSAKYNVKLIRKAMLHVKRRSLTFADISKSRIAFDLYAYDDGSGIAAELTQIQQALKMLERVMSPTKLQTEIQVYGEIADVPTRFQMYEFLDIVAKCKTTEAEVKRMSEKECCDHESRHSEGLEYPLPDFNQSMMTTDQRVRAFLESEYQDSLPKKPTQHVTVKLDDDKVVNTDSRRHLVSLALKQSSVLTSCIELSQSQLHRTRNGFCVLSDKQYLKFHHSSVPTCVRQKTSPEKQEHQATTHKSVKVHLQPLPQEIPQTQVASHSEQKNETKTSEDIKQDINDICAGSVIRARSTLQSSWAAIPKSHLMAIIGPQVPTDEANTPPALKDSVVRTDRLQLEAIVSSREQEIQQGLIDELHWAMMNSKEHESS